MLKKEVAYTDIIGGEEVELSETLRFVYTLAAVRAYDQNTGREYFKDYNAALTEFSEALGKNEIVDIENMTQSEQLQLLPLMASPIMNKFMMELVPCMYAEVQDGILVQSEETYDIAQNSMWLMPLTGVEFFMEIFQELSSGLGKQKKRAKKAKA